jgi:hypothetical protein
MKRIPIGAVLSALLIFTLPAAGKMPVVHNSRLTPNEAKALIRSASTPDEHLRLAEYFRTDALEEAAFAALNNQMADNFEIVGVRETHCREVARAAAKAAEHASRVAAEQEKMADMMLFEPQSHASHGSR